MANTNRQGRVRVAPSPLFLEDRFGGGLGVGGSSVPGSTQDQVQSMASVGGLLLTSWGARETAMASSKSMTLLLGILRNSSWPFMFALKLESQIPKFRPHSW